MPSYRILIVEDQSEVSHLLRSALETLEYKFDVVEIPSGEEAILDASRNKVDLLVSDYRLPGITGIEVMKKIRGFRPAAKVILITGLSDVKVRKEVAEAGADSFFIKPVPIADFLDAVERNLGLVESILPAELIVTKESEGLPDLLSGLRQNMNAQAVLLINDRGRIVARAGDLPDNSTEVSLTSSLMAIFAASQKVIHLIGQKTTSNWHIFDGDTYDLIFTSVGTTHAILVAGGKLAVEENVLKNISSLSDSRQSIEQALQAMGVSSSPISVMPPVALEEKHISEAGSVDLEPLFKKAGKKLKPEEVDAFWNAAVDKQKAAPTKPNIISYEQARKLGLAPEEGKGKGK